MNRIDEIVYEETQEAAYEEQCKQGFIHQEQPNEDYFEGLNDYLDVTNECLKCVFPMDFKKGKW